MFGIKLDSHGWIKRLSRSRGETWARRSRFAGPHGQRSCVAAGRPIADQEVLRRWRGEVTPLATLRGGAPLGWARWRPVHGAAYFVATDAGRRPIRRLATNGVVLFTFSCSAPWPAERSPRSGIPASSSPASRSRTTRPRGRQWVAGAPGAAFGPISHFTAASTCSWRRSCWRSTADGQAEAARRCWADGNAWPACFKASTMPGWTTRPAASAH